MARHIHQNKARSLAYQWHGGTGLKRAHQRKSHMLKTTIAKILNARPVGEMSQREALKLAQLRVGTPCRYQGQNQHTLYAPWKATDPHGPTTETRHATYGKAMQHRALIVADIALTYYMGLTGSDLPVLPWYAMYRHLDHRGTATAQQLLSVGVESVRDQRLQALRCDLIDWLSGAEVDE